MRVVLALGVGLRATGEPGPRYRLRLARAAELLMNGTGDILVLSGGRTQASLPTEAEAGLASLPEAVQKRTILETSAKTTSENIQHTKRLLTRFDEQAMESLVVVTSTEHVPRVRYLVRQLWPEVYDRTSFVGVGEPEFRERVCEFALRILARVDPYNRVFLAIPRKIFRNA